MDGEQAKLRVMIVDDEPELSYILGHLLRPEYEVVLAANGLEALERLDRYEPDLIVMDVMMPVIDGFDTTRGIKKNARFADVPVLFLTARTDNVSVREGLLSGGEMYLQKPFVPDDFLARIREMVTKGRVEARPKQFTIEEIEKFFSAHPAVEDEKDDHSTPGPEPPAQRSPNRTPSSQSPSRPRVLVVDDEREVVSLAKAVLRDKYEVIGTTDSDSVPDKILSYQPDVLIADIVMPRLAGPHLQWLTQVNRRLRVSQTIFLSPGENGYLDSDPATRALSGDMLHKPFTGEQLRKKLEDVLRRPGFQMFKKRLNYTEVLRREGEI